MTSQTGVRSLPTNSIVKVAGVSFHQDAVRRVVECDEVRIRHDRGNEHDANACAVETLDGSLLGWVERTLAPRLSGPTPGGVWRARVEEVYRNDTWGLRVRVGPLITTRAMPDAGLRAGGLRHRADGVMESSDGIVMVADVEEPTSPDSCVADDMGEAAQVFAKSGRLLGTLQARDVTKVHVVTPQGRVASYPLAVVRILEVAAA